MTWIPFQSDGSRAWNSPRIKCPTGQDGYHEYPNGVENCVNCGLVFLYDPYEPLAESPDDAGFRELFGDSFGER